MISKARFLRRELANGVRVVCELRDLPIVSMSVTNPVGASHESSEIKGISHFIEHLVFTGTKTRTHEQISSAIEKRGGVLNAFTAQDVTSFWFKLPSEHISVGIDILSDLLLNPTFNKEKFEKEKKVIIEEISMYKDNPRTYVMDKIEENLYDKPFGESIIGSKETISAMNRDFVAEHFSKIYDPRNFVVSIVGNCDFDSVCKELEERFKPAGKELVLPQKIRKINKETIEEREGIDQAHFVFAFHAPEFNSREYWALKLLNAHLAMGMSSKLFLKIREERGLAYTVKGFVRAEKNYSYYAIYVGTRKEALGEVKNIILTELKKCEQLSERELADAKNFLKGTLKLSYEDSTEVMEELMFYEVITKAEEFYEQEKLIDSITLEEVRAAARFDNYSIAAVVPK
ncbi:insulinase family protein [Candidatus Pacearchaeota archaeon]|nr:MAG: insulinase family protein [Candidatus Pacearchaeota archaeon]